MLQYSINCLATSRCRLVAPAFDPPPVANDRLSSSVRMTASRQNRSFASDQLLMRQTSRCRVARSPAASGAASRRGLTHQSTHVLSTLASPPVAPGVAVNADRFSRSAT